jgi:hypothetical protein
MPVSLTSSLDTIQMDWTAAKLWRFCSAARYDVSGRCIYYLAGIQAE